MKKFKGVVIHCSDSEFGNAGMIDDWHRERGWTGIGYHMTILNGHIDKDDYVAMMDGNAEAGREWNKNGAHAKGYNDYFGICLIGVRYFTKLQFETLLKICTHLIKEHGIKVKNIIGHYECEGTSKTCPNFDVSEVRNLLLAELEELNG